MIGTLWRSLIVLVAISCGDHDENKGDTKSEKPGVSRMALEEGYGFVGAVTKYDGLRCSGVLLAHGLFVSAKHCFFPEEITDEEQKAVGFELLFPALSKVSSSDKRITVTGIEYDASQSDVNDIAYVFYDPSDTLGLVEPFQGAVNFEKPVVAGTPLSTVGFPVNPDGIQKIATFGCQRLERSGRLPPLGKDPGYDGVLYDTDCYAWWGNSGGGIFAVDKNDPEKSSPVSLEGVVTHTFEQLKSGDIDPKKIREDEFGRYVETVNYSAFKDATRLKELLTAYKNAGESIFADISPKL